MNYRFTLTFASEELRQRWVASETHQTVWPTIEKTLSSKNYRVLVLSRVTATTEIWRNPGLKVSLRPPSLSPCHKGVRKILW